jgi:hypothetical protein
VLGLLLNHVSHIGRWDRDPELRRALKEGPVAADQMDEFSN